MKNQNNPVKESQTDFGVYRAFAHSEIVSLIRKNSIEFIQSILEEEVEALCGKRFSRKEQDELAYRAGSEKVSVRVLNRKEQIKKPRVRKLGTEVLLQTYSNLKSDADLGEVIFKLMVSGLTTRRFQECLADVSDVLGVSKSKVSREFVKESRTHFNRINTRRFEEEFFAIFIDGIHVADEVIVVILGIDANGNKHFLSIVQGSSEHSEIVLLALRKLQDREIKFSEKVLVVSDGSKGIEKAIKQYFGDKYDHQRCILHKMRNITQTLPKEFHQEFQIQYKSIFSLNEYASAKEALNNLESWLGQISESAKQSLLEGKELLLTCHRINVPVAIRKTFLTTNPIDSAFSHPRFQLNRVKRWRKNRDMTVRWTGALLYSQELHFRRIKGYEQIPKFLERFTKNEISLDNNFQSNEMSLSA